MSLLDLYKAQERLTSAVWWEKKMFTLILGNGKSFSLTRNDLLIWILAIVGVWALYHSIDFDHAVLGIRH